MFILNDKSGRISCAKTRKKEDNKNWKTEALDENEENLIFIFRKRKTLLMQTKNRVVFCNASEDEELKKEKLKNH